MNLADAWQAAATLAAVAVLLAGGGLLALLLLGRERCRRDPLALGVASLVAATSLALLVALGLGAAGALSIALALPVAALLAGLLLLAWRRMAEMSEPAPAPQALLPPAGAGEHAGGALPAGPFRVLARRSAARLREHPVLALIAVQAAGSEALRGLLRPPLSWDSLMYHLLLAATWLQERAIGVVYGMFPTSFYGYVPANGSLWLWWWMAPSHSELYVNLAFLPHWLLLGLATGGVARELGARRCWPLASYLVLLCPTIVRFAATQYVDILLAAMLMAAAFFGLCWLRSPRGADAAVAGLALGVAAGTKVVGPPYALVLAAALAAVAVSARGAWRTRLRQAALAALLATLLGSYFYLRNMAAGAGPLALSCFDAAPPGAPPRSAPARSVVANFAPMLADGTLVDAFLGFTAPASLELGIGPQALLLLGALVLPVLLTAPWRRGAFVAWAEILCQVGIWLIVPAATAGLVFANVRYLTAAIGLAFAGLVAAAEVRGVAVRGLELLTAALLVQDLLMLHSVMPRGVRLAAAALDLLAAALVFSPALRRRVWRFLPALAGAATVALLAATPWLARFRAADRTRALATEFTAHDTLAKRFARAWGWLDRHGGTGTVAVAASPATYFIYPAMGMRLERRAVYANVNRQDLRSAVRYPGCWPRVDPDPEAWLANLGKLGVRWVHLSRVAESFPFPKESAWARARPERFALRYADAYNLIFELLPALPRRSP
jgi:hypothetical protein